jgi:hypothetical protein
MLAIETAEIGCTLIALSVPGLKPLLGKWFQGFGTSEMPKSHSSGQVLTIGSTPSRRPKGLTKLGSGVDQSVDQIIIKRASTRSRGIGAGESDDNLMERGGGDIILMRGMNDFSNAAGNDVKMESYHDGWTHAR